MKLITELPEKEFFEKVLEDCRVEVRLVGPPMTFLKVFGDVTQNKEWYLRSFFCQGFTLINDDEDLKKVFLYLDKRLEAVQRVLARNGLDLTLLFNIRFLEDWSTFHPIEPDNIDDKTKTEWSWDTIQQKIMELFHNELRQELYDIIGIGFCSTEIISWIRLFVSCSENEEWWNRHISCLLYNSDS